MRHLFAALLLVAGAAVPARATTVDFSFGSLGTQLGHGSFSYATGRTGQLSIRDLTAFFIEIDIPPRHDSFDLGYFDDLYSLRNTYPYDLDVYFDWDATRRALVPDQFGTVISGVGIEGDYGFALYTTGVIDLTRDANGDIADAPVDSIVATVRGEPVPEPASAALLLTALAGGAAVSRWSARPSRRTPRRC